MTLLPRVKAKARAHPLATVLLLGIALYALVIPIDGGILWDKDVWKDWGWVMAHYPLEYLYMPDGPTLSPDHLPGDMLLYKFVQVVYTALGFTSFEYSYTIAYKLLSVTAVFLVGALLLRFLNLWQVKHSPALVFAAVIFNPLFLLDSAWWGQWDAVSLAVALAAMISMLRPTPHLGFFTVGVMWATWACSMKPQIIILLLPIALVALYRLLKTHGCLRAGAAAGISLFTAAGLLAGISSAFGLTLFGEYSFQSVLLSIKEVHWALAPGAPTNFWWLAGADKVPAGQEWLGVPLNTLGIILVVLVTAVAAWLGRRQAFTFERAFLGLALLFMVYYYFTFIMHERYLLPAFAPWLIWAVIAGTKRAWVSYWLAAVLVSVAALGVVARWGLEAGTTHDLLFILTAAASYGLAVPLAILVLEWVKPQKGPMEKKPRLESEARHKLK